MLKSFLTGLLAAAAVIYTGTAVAQTTSISPYSRFGLGDINPSVGAAQFGLGGLGTGYADNTFINLSNPATPAFLSKMTFDAGIRHNNLYLSGNAGSEHVTTTYINHFAYAFKVKDKYCLTAGLLPYSRFGYTINDTRTVDTLQMDIRYTGTGGINRAFLGNSYKILNRKDSTQLSVGFNANFLFGTIGREVKSYLPYTSNYFNTRSQVYSTVHDVTFDIGTYFSFYPNREKPLKLNFGATYTFGTSLKTSQEVIKQTFITNALLNEFPVDTIDYFKDTKGSITIPQTISLGASMVYKDRWVVGVDYRTQTWSQFSQDLRGSFITNDLKNSSQVSVGVQFTPKTFSAAKTSLFKLMNYRIGYRYENTYIQVKGEQISGNAFTGGLGIPLRRSNSLTRINIGYEMYTRGTTSNNLLKERYTNLVIGVSLSPNVLDRWFYKTKYD
ncbi:MAG: hypothetical protein V4616_12210 [Bacteroidota bacterium]